MNNSDVENIILEIKKRIELIKDPSLDKIERDKIILWFDNYFKNLPLEARNNKALAEIAILYKTDNYKYIGDDLKNNKEMALFIYNATCDVNTINNDLIDEEFIVNTIKSNSFRKELLTYLYKNNPIAFGKDYFSRVK